MFARLFGRKKPAPEASAPTPHAVQVTWDNWSPPGPNDVRSPCPAINALANHNILPHSGREITKATAIAALTQAYHIDPTIAGAFAMGGVMANPAHDATTFDLNHVSKHNYIEHDASLSRDDAAFGNAEKFDAKAFDMVLATFRAAHPGMSDEEITTDWGTAGRARWARVAASKAKHEEANKSWLYGIKEAVMSYGETSLYLNLLGKDGVAPLKWVRIFFEEERLPYKEGWRPPAKFDQSDLNHGYAEMLKGGEHGVEEAKWVGIGTLVGLKAAILGLGASFIKMPSA